MPDVSALLLDLERGDPTAAAQLLPLVYDELRRLAAARMAQEAPGQSLQATALVHEAYLRLLGPGVEQNWNGRGHFFAAAAEAMRRILVESARRRRSQKRGGDYERIELADLPEAVPEDPVDLLALDDALQELERQRPNQAQVVKLRFFAGCTLEETALSLGISRATAERHWAFARAWLYGKLHQP